MIHRDCDTQSVVTSVTFFATASQTFGKEWETVCSLRITGNDGHKPKTKKENHIMKSRKYILTIHRCCTLTSLVTSANSSPAAPERCDGTVQLTSQSNFQVRQAGTQTFVQFDFTGLHDICLADHSVVTGIVEGHLVQRISANGDFSLTFDEVLSYNGGTLGYRGEGSLTGGNWQSNVMTVGLGTGPLAGIHGQGTFVFTGPASLADVIYYVYTP